MNAATPIESPNSKPSTRERWMSAAPMFVCFVLIALAPRIISKFDEVLRATRLAVPIVTQIVFSLSHAIQTMPWLFTAFMFVVAWSYFTWIAKDKRRIRLFNIWILIFAGGSFGIVVLALFMPIMGIQETLHKK